MRSVRSYLNTVRGFAVRPGMVHGNSRARGGAGAVGFFVRECEQQDRNIQSFERFERYQYAEFGRESVENYVPFEDRDFYDIVALAIGESSDFEGYIRNFNFCYEMPLDQLLWHIHMRGSYFRLTNKESENRMKPQQPS